MPWGSVKPTGPAGREVYVNGNYEQSAGQANCDLAVEYGLNTFETLDAKSRIDLRAEALVDDAHRVVVTPLLPVVPPEPTAATPPSASEAPSEAAAVEAGGTGEGGES